MKSNTIKEEEFLLEVKDFVELSLKELWATSELTPEEFIQLDVVVRGNDLLNNLSKYEI